MGLLGYIVQCDINSENHFLFSTTYNNNYNNNNPYTYIRRTDQERGAAPCSVVCSQVKSGDQQKTTARSLTHSQCI